VQGAELLPALASVSLLAAETDFSEPGEMGVLIDESQVTLLEEEKIMAYYGAGTLYATPSRQEPLL